MEAASAAWTRTSFVKSPGLEETAIPAPDFSVLPDDFIVHVRSLLHSFRIMRMSSQQVNCFQTGSPAKA